MKIEWRKVTWYSKIIALIALAVFIAGGFYLGMRYEQIKELANYTPPAFVLHLVPSLSSISSTQSTTIGAVIKNASSSHWIQFTSATGTQTLCLGQDYPITWKSNGIDLVDISVSSIGGGWGGSMDVVPTDYYNETGAKQEGEYLWKAGYFKGMNEGEGYYVINLHGLYTLDPSQPSYNPRAYDQTQPIYVQNCQGQ